MPLNNFQSRPERDQIDLDHGTLGKRSRLDGGAGRLVVAEVAGVDGVEGLEVGQVGDVDGGLDDLPEAGAGFLQDRFEVAEDAMGLGSEVAFDEVAGGGVDGGLAGAEYQAVGDDGL